MKDDQLETVLNQVLIKLDNLEKQVRELKKESPVENEPKVSDSDTNAQALNNMEWIINYQAIINKNILQLAINIKKAGDSLSAKIDQKKLRDLF